MNMGSDGRERISALAVRRADSSLLVAPTAGVLVRGTRRVGLGRWNEIAHRVPQDRNADPLAQALHLPAAEQLPNLFDLFASVEWWRLRPAQEMILVQPGETSAGEMIMAAKTDGGDLAIIYTPVA